MSLGGQLVLVSACLTANPLITEGQAHTHMLRCKQGQTYSCLPVAHPSKIQNSRWKKSQPQKNEFQMEIAKSCQPLITSINTKNKHAQCKKRTKMNPIIQTLKKPNKAKLAPSASWYCYMINSKFVVTLDLSTLLNHTISFPENLGVRRG